MAYYMRTRQEMKEIAKARLSENRGVCIGVYLLSMAVGVLAGGMTLGIGALVVMPAVIVAANGFFAQVYGGKAVTVSDWFSSLFDNFLRKVGGYLWMMLWVMLWTLLFYVPGIVKAFSYSMAPYILADCPNVRAKDALRLSIRMTDGYKMDIFVTYLSFLGWIFLSAFTFGILQILHVGPYMGVTLGGVYQELKANALENGTIRPEELEGGPVAY